MRQCYFCNGIKSLKAIWYEYYDDEVHNHSCCQDCFNDPDNSMDDSPIGSTEWYSTDYNWQTKEERMKEKKNGTKI